MEESPASLLLMARALGSHEDAFIFFFSLWAYCYGRYAKAWF